MSNTQQLTNEMITMCKKAVGLGRDGTNPAALAYVLHNSYQFWRVGTGESKAICPPAIVILAQLAHLSDTTLANRDLWQWAYDYCYQVAYQERTTLPEERK